MHTQALTHTGAVLSGAYIYPEPDAGRILMNGRDRAALLHRLSSNDIEHVRAHIPDWAHHGCLDSSCPCG